MSDKSNTKRAGIQVGDIIDQNGKEFVCWFLNDSRACIAPLSANIEYKTREEDGKIQFAAPNSENISPNSEVKVSRSLGRKGLAEYLDKLKTSKGEKQMSDKKDKKKDKKKDGEEGEGRAGKLGGWKGHSITSVIRALGKAGWNLDEARQWLKDEGIAAADNTVKIQLRRGKIGEGEPAKLGGDMPKKPKVEAKAEKSEKADKKDKKKSKDKGDKKKDKKKSKDKGEAKKDDDAGAEEGEGDEDGEEADKAE